VDISASQDWDVPPVRLLVRRQIAAEICRLAGPRGMGWNCSAILFAWGPKSTSLRATAKLLGIVRLAGSGVEIKTALNFYGPDAALGASGWLNGSFWKSEAHGLA